MIDETAGHNSRILVEADAAIVRLIAGVVVGGLEGAAVHDLQTTGITNRGTNTGVTATSLVVGAEDMIGDVSVVGDVDVAHQRLDRPHLAHLPVDVVTRAAASALVAILVKDQGRSVAIGMLGTGGIDTVGRAGHVLNPQTGALQPRSGEGTPHLEAGLESDADAIRAHHRARRGDTRGLEATAVAVIHHLIEDAGLHRQAGVGNDVVPLRPMALMMNGHETDPGASDQVNAAGGETALLPRLHHLHQLAARLLMLWKMNGALLAIH